MIKAPDMFSNYDFTVAERFMRYVQTDTQSDPHSTSFPSTEKQKNLSRILVKELREMGIADAELVVLKEQYKKKQPCQHARQWSGKQGYDPLPLRYDLWFSRNKSSQKRNKKKTHIFVTKTFHGNKMSGFMQKNNAGEYCKPF